MLSAQAWPTPSFGIFLSPDNWDVSAGPVLCSHHPELHLGLQIAPDPRSNANSRALSIYSKLFRSQLMVRISLSSSLSASQGSVLGLVLGYVLMAWMMEMGVYP